MVCLGFHPSGISAVKTTSSPEYKGTSKQVNNNNNKNQNTNTAANLQSNNNSRPVYVNRHGQAQNQPRQQRPQQRMQRPQPMQRPVPILSPVERMEMERKAWLARLPIGISHRSYNWLFEEPENPGMQAKPVETPVTPAAPVAAPVVKPSYRKDSGRAKRKAQVVEVDAPWLDPKEASRAYVESIAWNDRRNAEWTATKVQLAGVDMIKSAKEPTPAELLAGPGLSFKAAHELLRRRHVAEDAGDFLILSREAGAHSPWGGGMDALARESMRLLIAEFANELSVREAAEEAVRGARREMRSLRYQIECGAYSAPAERPESDAELKAERAESAMEEDYERLNAMRVAPRISGSRSSSKPVHKGQPKAVAKRDVGRVVDPNMVRTVAHVEEQMDKRQVADLIGPKVVARRVR